MWPLGSENFDNPRGGMHASKESGRRMCWHCEGYVAMHLTQCPYCQAFLQDPTFSGPYSPVHKSDMEQESVGLIDPFALPSGSPWDDSLEGADKMNGFSTASVKTNSFLSKEAFSLLFLFFGMGLVIFGLFIAFFGDAEGLVLRWSRSKAFYYVLAGLPLLYKGCKSCIKSEKKDNNPDGLL